jgi:hypothetical protein
MPESQEHPFERSITLSCFCLLFYTRCLKPSDAQSNHGLSISVNKKIIFAYTQLKMRLGEPRLQTLINPVAADCRTSLRMKERCRPHLTVSDSMPASVNLKASKAIRKFELEIGHRLLISRTINSKTKFQDFCRDSLW